MNLITIQSAVDRIRALDQQLYNIILCDEIQQKSLQHVLEEIQHRAVPAVLSGIDIDQINQGKAGIRVQVFRDQGIHNVAQVHEMSLEELKKLKGVGDQTAKKVKEIVNDMAKTAAQSTAIRLKYDDPSAENRALINGLYVHLHTKGIVEKCREFYNRFHDMLMEQADLAAKLTMLPRLSGPSLEAFQYLDGLLQGAFPQSVERQTADYERAILAEDDEKFADFIRRAAEYYAILEKLVPYQINLGTIQNDLPADLAAAINNYPLDRSFLKATLRPYQEFGCKYILHQKNVLLGDEMGLGKTVEAIAAMASLAASEKKSHFMVVCPAGVLINWCKEITQHSQLRPVKIHGGDLKALKEWMGEGGVAVTTYESLQRFSLPMDFRFDMLVVDEAHYVKNPYAKRTKAICALSKQCQRMLFMTGTPLENRVDEMCHLVNCLQPQVAKELKEIRGLASAPVFREKLAPVYLRRTREEVLQELPELIESEEWVDLSQEERIAYNQSVIRRNFMGMRQVSWNVSDITKSAKARRLVEICNEAAAQQRKVIVFSYFRHTIDEVCKLLKGRCLDPITGSVPPQRRLEIIEEFREAPGGSVLVSQVDAGGTGLNIQTASIVIFCEPQLKPSTENQAVARVYRMGQVRNVLVYRLLGVKCVDEHIMKLLHNKQVIFDHYAEESVMNEEAKQLSEKEWIQQVIDKETAGI